MNHHTSPDKEVEPEGENEAGASTKSTTAKQATSKGKDGSGDAAIKTCDPKSRLEVRRWRRGCYTLLHDNDREQEYSLDARYGHYNLT